MESVMHNQTQYVSKIPDKDGYRTYSDTEHQIWAKLYAVQEKSLPGIACPEYMSALEEIGLPRNSVPQLKDINETLKKKTGWGIEGVPALISFERFFGLLAEKKFPAATFIRTSDDFEYLQEPDIFHEIFGHCPLLMNEVYTDFMQKFGELAASASAEDQIMLARLYWFTVEFGLIQSNKDLQIYGAGIVSSVNESKYALSNKPQKYELDLVEVFRTLYRIDIMQPIYFVISSFDQLFNLVDAPRVVFESIAEARSLGPHKPLFAVGDLPEDDLRKRIASQS